MGADSKIEWTDHTFNPWWGCTKVSPGCDHCYAERMAKRQGVAWGPGAARRKATDAAWVHPPIWNRRAERLGIRPRVFCASMADVFDNEVPEEWRARMFDMIDATPNLDWLLLTKRIGNVLKTDWRDEPRDNVWLGISVVNQEEADRDIPKLLSVPARVRFLSCEPLLGPINLLQAGAVTDETPGMEHAGKIDWVIVGGESGPGARHMEAEWAADIREQCERAGIAFFMKQMTKKAPIPDALMLRQFPAPLTNSHPSEERK